MELTVSEGDELIIWWPNGAGYDVYLVVQREHSADFVLQGKYEVESTGKYVKV